MDDSKHSKLLKEIKEYISILNDFGSLEGLPEQTLTQLHKMLGTAVALMQHMQEGED